MVTARWARGSKVQSFKSLILGLLQINILEIMFM